MNERAEVLAIILGTACITAGMYFIVQMLQPVLIALSVYVGIAFLILVGIFAIERLSAAMALYESRRIQNKAAEYAMILKLVHEGNKPSVIKEPEQIKQIEISDHDREWRDRWSL